MTQRTKKHFRVFDAIVGISLIAVFFLIASSYYRSHNKPLSTKTNSVLPSMKGIVTNQWYSSLYFQEWSNNIFAFPLAYNVSANGIGISYPQVHATSNTVFAPFTQDILVSLVGNAPHKEVVSADAASVTLKYCSDAGCLLTHFVHGAPSATFRATVATTAMVSAPSLTSIENTDTNTKINFASSSYLVGIVRNQKIITVKLDSNQHSWQVPLQKDDLLVFGLQSKENSLNLTDLQTEIVGSSFSYRQDQNNLITTLNYQTSDGQTPLIAFLPHQWLDRMQQPLGTYQTLRGTMKIYKTEEITENLKSPNIINVSQMVNSLDAQSRQQLENLLIQTTTEASKENPITGVYDGGKQVFRIAQLYQIALALKSDAAQTLKNQLTQFLMPWLEFAPSSDQSLLKLNTQPLGIIAKNPQYGNEQFNDHHFDYGYYLAAAGILLQSDPTLTTQFLPGIKALLNDVANTDPTNNFPILRGFDSYESHSWADGRGLFDDGNNQESTSEAINRWYGIHEVGLGLKRDDLTLLGNVGLAMEQQGSQTYWLGQNPDLYSFPTGYAHPMASLIWGGKVDFATWFSNKNSNIYGIQFLPITPAMTHIVNSTIWNKYTDYQPSNDPNAWNDILNMVSVSNGNQTPDELPTYEAGNSSPFYFLWVHYWTQINSGKNK